MKRSMYRYCISVRLESIEYKIMTDTNWQRLYAAMYLNIPKDVTKAARPSRITVGTQEMLATFDVKGEATDDSASDRDMPV